MDSNGNSASAHACIEARIEDLGLSVRTRRALRRYGCATVGDVLRLNLDIPIRGLGQKSKEELLARMEDAGIMHPGSGLPSEIVRLERHLNRLQRHLDSILGVACKELRVAREQLQKLKARTPHVSY